MIQLHKRKSKSKLIFRLVLGRFSISRLREKGHEPSQAAPSQAEKPSARGLARASLARTHHYCSPHMYTVSPILNYELRTFTNFLTNETVSYLFPCNCQNNLIAFENQLVISLVFRPDSLLLQFFGLKIRIVAELKLQTAPTKVRLFPRCVEYNRFEKIAQI